ncbi:MAG: carboxypeptidase regulatory-like domain-containing protein, partial [Bacteroidales bacterium]|nr:carboxypeptidase regulatory-like domain-containing protein [Bacteroidales bacterium]
MRLKTLLTSILFMAAVLTASAQKYNIKAQFVDSKSGEGVEFATVSITPAGSDKVLTYTLTDGFGNFELKGVKGGKYLLKSELLGYDKFSQEITLEKDVDMGKLKMAVQVNFLEGAMISDVGNPIVMKKDTVEFNATSFKTTDNDMLEDLLKKLPGVEVDTDGTITSNGKTISKITIDGKTFFLDDPQLASKNIPAKIINKVKVVEKKSEQAEFTGIDDGNEETVIDLSVMKGMMNGWFGNVSGGGGSDVRSASSARDNDFRFQG